MRFDWAAFYRRLWLASLAASSLSMTPTGALAACRLSPMVELPVTMSNSKPVIIAKINGEDARFVADSGAFFSMITEASAAEFKLRLSPAPRGLFVKGVGGILDPSIATVKVFTFAGIPVRNVEFLVGGSTVGGGAAGGSENVGVLGQNFFRIGDVEYDLARGIIRLMRAEGCGHARLAYWARDSEPYSLMDIEEATSLSPHTTGTASINGAKIKVMFDSGAGTSILSLNAAERAGVKPDSEGVFYAGYDAGVGRTQVQTYIGRFSSFKIGDEEIRNAQLRFGDIGIDGTDMLIGADFFLSHRIYVASSQRKLYFTYNGGPVFNLTSSPGKMPAQPTVGASPQDIEAGDELSDAAAYSRRGTAFAARRDYEHAIADLTRACELDPNDAEYFYQRGIAYRDNKRIELALADFNRALELNPVDVSALAARAQLRMKQRDIAGASADLDTADRAARREADIRLFLARGYQSADLLPASIAQYDLWISAHAADSRMPDALTGRCRARALLDQDLGKALADCNAALQLTPRSSSLTAGILDSRGLVHLRLGDYDKSIADYDNSLKLAPDNGWSLYGRGVAKMRKTQVPEGEADIAAASAIWGSIGDEFKRHGIIP
jgi:tetratricopeptide (TPR) repeat protein/predicted aspartyl protease